MKNLTTKKAVATTALAAASILASGQESTDVSALPSNLEWHFADGQDKARINLFYNLPLKTQGYSFMEFSGKGGYFGKTLLYTPFDDTGMGLKTETSHALFTNPQGEEISYNKIGFGLEQRVRLPGKIDLSVKAIPFILGNNSFKDMETVAGYCASKSFRLNEKMDITLSSFLDISIKAQKKPVSDYGETDAALSYKTKLGQFYLGAGYNHNVSGKLAPDNQFRVRVGYHPKK